MVERNISEAEIRQAGRRARIIEDYADDKYAPSCLLLGFTTEVSMFRCQVCGATEARSEVVSEVFLVDGLPVLTVCDFQMGSGTIVSEVAQDAILRYLLMMRVRDEKCAVTSSPGRTANPQPSW
jgi:hypothetical protein